MTLTAAGLSIFRASGHDVGDVLHGNVANNTLLGVSFAVVALIVTWARPRNGLGWLLHLLAFANGFTVFAEAWGEHALITDPGSLPFGTAFAWLAWMWVVGFIPTLTVLLAIYPDGRAVGRARRTIVAAGWTATAVTAVGLALSDNAYDDVVPGARNPVAPPGAQRLAEVLGATGMVLAIIVAVAAVVLSLIRLRRSSHPEREQLAWLVAATVAAVANFVAPQPVVFVTDFLFPVAIAIGLLRYQLLDIKLALRRTLVYGLLTTLVIAVYAGVVAALTALVPGRALSPVVAAAAVAVGIRPAYDLLQRGVSRLVYGDRDDPVRALGRLGRRLAAESKDEGLLPAVARSVADALRVPYVAVYVGQDPDPAAVFGSSSGGPVHHLPLVSGGPVGAVDVGRRTPGEPLGAADVALLDVLSAPLAVAVRAASLAEELRVSRQQLAAATDAERARLRQELHDGLGPQLSGVALGLEAAALAKDDPQTLDELLPRLRGEVHGAVAEVRHIVEGLRPAALDGATLLTAVRRHAEAIAASSAGGLRVEVDGPADLPALPPDVETAAYRIALEAMTNVVRHAEATTCTVTLRATDALEVDVRDDGRGVGSVNGSGRVGLDSMRARAVGLGGSLSVGPSAGGGTRVLARLPLVTS